MAEASIRLKSEGLLQEGDPKTTKHSARNPIGPIVFAYQPDVGADHAGMNDQQNGR